MDPFIYKVEQALTPNECLILIGLFDNENFRTRISKGPVNQYTQSSGDFSYEVLVLDANKSLFRNVLYTSILKYTNLHPFLNKRPFKISTMCNLQRYKVGESYSTEHCENDGSPGMLSLRNIAWMFYLNDIESKGGTCFPSQNITLKPRVGDLYIWPAYWTHSHYGIAADKEIKYLLTGWCRYLKFSEIQELNK